YTIGPVTCAPGERAQGLIPVGAHSYGVQLGIPLLVVNGTAPGPVLCVDGGRQRATSTKGMEAVRRVVATTDPETLGGPPPAGIPLGGPPPPFQGREPGPSGLDHANLNRIFPGDADGSYSLRLAATFVDQVIPAIDALVDLHTGGTFGEIAPLTIVQGGYEELGTPIGLAAGHELIWKGRLLGRYGPAVHPPGGQARHHHRGGRRYVPRGDRGPPPRLGPQHHAPTGHGRGRGGTAHRLHGGERHVRPLGGRRLLPRPRRARRTVQGGRSDRHHHRPLRHRAGRGARPLGRHRAVGAPAPYRTPRRRGGHLRRCRGGDPAM
ncbi:LOW QUALITY PROTEIN: succinate dehydrogenase subunit, partial [Streptomyces himastatinicus ATCC 53653]